MPPLMAFGYFFAILDRKKYPEMSLFNSCLQAQIAPHQLNEPSYFFSITKSVLIQNPWCKGAIYILPRSSFRQEAPQQMQGVEIIFPHWISTTPVEPVAKIIIGAQDFQFLSQIHGYNDQNLVQYAAANPNGFPWPEALES
jgi:hypothetical protein